jgi:hypothetical protein
MLTARRQAAGPNCTCIGTLRARDAVELRDWIDGAREAGAEPAPGDARLAAIVRAVDRGDADAVGPYVTTRLTQNAIRAVVDGALARRAESDERARRADDPSVGRFWNTLLSTSTATKTKDRLDAFGVLDDLGALPRCRCEPEKQVLEELQLDARRAFVIRMVAERHYRAALVIAHYPETHVAVREVIDAALLRAAVEEPDGDGNAEAA